MDAFKHGVIFQTVSPGRRSLCCTWKVTTIQRSDKLKETPEKWAGKQDDNTPVRRQRRVTELLDEYESDVRSDLTCGRLWIDVH